MSPDNQPASAGGNDDASAAAEQLNAFAGSKNVQTLLESLEHHLSSEITKRSYGEIWDSGSLLIGSAGFGAIIWASEDDSPEKIEALDLSPEAGDLVTRICALYGSRLKRAFELSDLFANKADDWESVKRQVFRDVKDEGYLIKTIITKRNGEKVILSGGLSSAARLAWQTLRTLLAVDDLSTLEDEDRERLQTILDEVAVKLRGEQAPESPSTD